MKEWGREGLRQKELIYRKCTCTYGLIVQDNCMQRAKLLLAIDRSNCMNVDKLLHVHVHTYTYVLSNVHLIVLFHI